MAHRDRSQGFAFMYVDISSILAQRDELKKMNESAPVMAVAGRTANFNRDAAPTRPAAPAPASKADDRTAAVAQIRENLDRLQALHHKLHAMLEDLNKIAGNDKKKR